VRVHFLHEIWDLWLPDSQSEVVVELWGRYPRGVPSREAGGKGPVIQMALYVLGKARLRTRDKDYQLPNLSEVTWSNMSPQVAGPRTLPSLPAWWTYEIDKTPTHVAGALLALLDFDKLLSDKTDSVVDTVFTQVKESNDPFTRNIGVLFLGALDALPFLVEALENPKYPEVRGSAAFVLRNWMSRNADNDAELFRMLGEQRAYSKEKAEIIIRLLHSVSEADAAKPKTYQDLISYLDHDNLAIRQLAFWHLSFLVPEGAQQIVYDPAADAEQRKPACEQWKKLLANGKVLPRPSPAPR
jgi:hypothetical protein